ncbi:hypothetical protein GA0061078_1633 [Bifidobacterium bohemicum]|uniref:Uncharacterized protein n=1 Tax=Bifidobacterium bohemicum DSM 22767 TaxID=1437606 RepID=A0A086ZHB8_9BIFI|nr:hypothetical protein [Bifidobacterium bohemicum]KFI45918.1 hypothetical protein BBOH_0725 [Bifidobacterium bohemicum DSM 22767]SCC15086.1 hypothetical protein GA0061078_1633 [Bifidobacterium bohemicum]
MSTETYDPMIYDTMRETANRLVGKYSSRLKQSSDMNQREALLKNISGVRRWVSGIDANDKQSVLDTTNQLCQLCDDQSVLLQVEELAMRLTGKRDDKSNRQVAYV